MQWLENRIPPPLFLLVVLISMGVIARIDSDSLFPLGDGLWTTSIGVALAAAGVVCSVLGVVSFRRAQTTVNPLRPEKASHLVCSGVFRYSRNPMYLGMLLVCLGWAMHLNSPWALTGVLGFVGFITRFQIVPEERAMLALFGEQFERYRAQTRRWI